MRVFVSICAVLSIITSGKPAESQGRAELRIVSPADNDRVDARPMIRGIAPTAEAKVWIVVHPLETSDYWVQPRMTVKKDRTWKVKIYLGTEGTADSGKEFELLAVANPKAKLSEGLRLSDFPEAKWKSDVLSLTRK